MSLKNVGIKQENQDEPDVMVVKPHMDYVKSDPTRQPEWDEGSSMESEIIVDLLTGQTMENGNTAQHTTQSASTNENQGCSSNQDDDDEYHIQVEEFDDWCMQLQESSTDEAGDSETSASHFVINLEAAFLPPQASRETLEWLANQDAAADKTIRQLLPINDLSFNWDNDPTTFNAQRECTKSTNFAVTPGPTFTLESHTTPLTVFSKFFDDNLLDLIVRETNKYSDILIERITTENSRLLKWKDTNREEMGIFLAIIILQGLAPLNAECDYWKENGYLTLKYFKNLMIYNRFILLKRMLHFADEQTDQTRLSASQKNVRKIWPVMEDLNRKFSKLYIPQQDLAIDESLLNWHGRRSFAQKIATKAKDGVKSCELCEAETGYLWRFFVYSGKGVKIPTDMTINATTDMNEDDDFIMTNNDRQKSERTSASSLAQPPQNITAQILQTLAKPLLGKGYTLIMDSLCTSPLLARYLKSQKTDCFGTVRIDRESVPEAVKSFTKTGMQFGEVVHTYSRDISIMLWKDTNIVSMLSTFHDGKTNTKDKHGRNKQEIVCDYYKAMGGIAKRDQQLSAYPMERSGNQSWYKKVFRRLLNVTLHNAFVIFKTQNPCIPSRAFRQRLADEMIVAYKPGIPSTLQVKPTAVKQWPKGKGRPILQGNHFMGPGVSKNARCVWCRKCRTKYICKQCGVSLCFNICFEEYHTKY